MSFTEQNDLYLFETMKQQQILPFFNFVLTLNKGWN